MKNFLFIFILFIGAACTPRLVTQPYHLPEISFPPPEAKQKANAQIACRSWEHHLPDLEHPEHLPMKFIRVNFHIFNKLDSTANYKPTEAKTYFLELLRLANAALDSNVANWRSPAGTPVLPRRYRYVLEKQPGSDEGFYFHFNDSTYYFVGSGRYQNNYNMEVVHRYAVGKDTVLNIFVQAHPTDSLQSKQYRAVGQGIALGTTLKMAGIYESKISPDGFEGLMNHEIGHILSLAHAWTEDGCPDTDNHPNKCFVCEGAAPCDSICTNNMMDYNMFQLALTPCQIGKVHSTFGNEKSKVRKCLVPNWCHYHPEQTIFIKKNTIWSGHRDLEGDVVIENGAELRLSCRLSLPPSGRIIVQPGGKLILEAGARLHQSCDKTWRGIFTQSKKNSHGIVEILGVVQLENLDSQILR